ncbi:hypothetical protein DERP_005578, partial [Dermatophagoides pteronyssinus]
FIDCIDYELLLYKTLFLNFESNKNWSRVGMVQPGACSIDYTEENSPFFLDYYISVHNANKWNRDLK